MVATAGITVCHAQIVQSYLPDGADHMNPVNTWFFWPSQIRPSNGICIGRDQQTDKQTDRQTICISSAGDVN